MSTTLPRAATVSGGSVASGRDWRGPRDTRQRGANGNWRTGREQILERAGLTPWPKLFQDLSTTRASELANEYPAHVEAASLGHSTAIASKHYWQVTDADFDRAAGAPSEKASPKAPQYLQEMSRNESQASGAAHEKTPVFFRGLQTFASRCD